MTLEPQSPAGLSTAEAGAALAAHGPNELPSARPRSTLAILGDVLREPMLLLLLASGGVYLLLGDPVEATALLASIFLVIGITLVQEQRSERALEALRSLSSPRALVVRDGRRVRIPGREVVPGDLAIVHDGDRVPADATLVSSLNLTVDESLLTGESVPVPKDESGPDARLFSGTLVVAGQGVARVTATGPGTELGKIGRSLAALEPRRSRLEEETGNVVRRLAVVGLALCAVVAVVYGATRGDWLRGALAGLTMAISVLPEEMPVILTVFLALGAWRISRQQVLTRRVPAIEALGSATVLCVDKTGTLTANRMAVVAGYAGGRSHAIDAGTRGPLPPAVEALVEGAVRASRLEAFDPMEEAFFDLGRRVLPTARLPVAGALLREYPLSRELLAVTNVWDGGGGGARVVATKGAPEAVFGLCHLGEREHAELAAEVERMAASGLRVLAVAEGALGPGVPLPGSSREMGHRFLGLVGLADPVRPGVPAAVRECAEAGIRVTMLTGDHPATARSIARQAGLPHPERVLTGRDLDAADDAEVRARVAGCDVFARIVPEQKLRLVRALQERGEVVAMTGDGVNDAPALKAADIGVAMGGRGTDVAREASDLVLLDDDFSSIVRAVRLGRRIYDNLKHAIAYVIAIHVPIAGMSMIPVLLRWPLVLLPMHVIFLEMVIDPACSIVFEAERERPDIMRRPPRTRAERLFTGRLVALGVTQGLGLLAVVLGVALWGMRRGAGEGETRALAFATLVLGNLALIFANRSRTRPLHAVLGAPNPALWWVTGGAASVLAVVLYVPAARQLFALAPLRPTDLAVCLGAALLATAWFEGTKRLLAR